MNDPQRNVDAVETAAAECELISKLAPAGDVRSFNTELAKQFVDIANDLKKIASEERVFAAQQVVARQRGFIARLQSQGHSTDQARKLLAVLEDTLIVLEQHRDLVGRLKR